MVGSMKQNREIKDCGPHFVGPSCLEAVILSAIYSLWIMGQVLSPGPINILQKRDSWDFSLTENQVLDVFQGTSPFR